MWAGHEKESGMKPMQKYHVKKLMQKVHVGWYIIPSQ